MLPPNTNYNANSRSNTDAFSNTINHFAPDWVKDLVEICEGELHCFGEEIEDVYI